MCFLCLSKLHHTPCPASGESDSSFSCWLALRHCRCYIVQWSVSVTCVPWPSASHAWGCTYPLKRMRRQCICQLTTHKLLLCGLTSPLVKPFSCHAQLQFSRKTVFQHLIEFSEHCRSLSSAEATVTSPLAVDFRGFVARQSPHVIYRQAGRLVGLQRQWGEPVQSHKWEEASVIDWVLVSGIESKMRKWVRCRKVQAYTEVQCWGRQAPIESGAFARKSWRKVNHARSVWTVICTLLTEIWESSEKRKSSGVVYQSAYVQTQRCLSLGDKFPPLIMASCYCLTV